MGMNQKLREFQTTIQNYNPKSLVEPDIFQTQGWNHKVMRIPHFTQFTEKSQKLWIICTQNKIEYLL